MTSKHETAYGALRFHVHTLSEHESHVSVMNDDNYENGNGALEIDTGSREFQIALRYETGISYQVSMTNFRTGESEATKASPANMGHALLDLCRRFEVLP